MRGARARGGEARDARDATAIGYRLLTAVRAGSACEGAVCVGCCCSLDGFSWLALASSVGLHVSEDEEEQERLWPRRGALQCSGTPSSVAAAKAEASDAWPRGTSIDTEALMGLGLAALPPRLTSQPPPCRRRHYGVQDDTRAPSVGDFAIVVGHLLQDLGRGVVGTAAQRLAKRGRWRQGRHSCDDGAPPVRVGSHVQHGTGARCGGAAHQSRQS